MKRFKYILRSFALLFLTIVPYTIYAQNKSNDISISLLTCGPGDNLYSLYGHTALRFQNKATGEDIVINYGMFSFQQDFFILRFVFGKTDYEMGIQPFEYFKEIYKHEGRWIKEQTLDLTPKEKLAIAQSLNENYQPQNRVYRYNFIFNNCATKANDMICQHLIKKRDFTNRKKTNEHASWRQRIHVFSQTSPWIQFGNDLLLGYEADKPATLCFLPIDLYNKFEKTSLVEKSQIIVSEDEAAAYAYPNNNNPIPRPYIIFSIISLLIIGITLYEHHQKKILWITDLFIFLTTGLAGLILFIMIFSEHPMVNINFQILLLNPLNFILTFNIIKKLQQGKLCFWLYAYSIILIIFIIIGFILQHYAEGLTLMACSLLIRYCNHIITLKPHDFPNNNE